MGGRAGRSGLGMCMRTVWVGRPFGRGRRRGDAAAAVWGANACLSSSSGPSSSTLKRKEVREVFIELPQEVFIRVLSD
jgi:hypothetical protein